MLLCLTPIAFETDSAVPNHRKLHLKKCKKGKGTIHIHRKLNDKARAGNEQKETSLMSEHLTLSTKMKLQKGCTISGGHLGDV